MKWTGRWFRRGKAVWASMGPARRAGESAAAVAALAGLVWLIAGLARPSMAPVMDRPWGPSELADARGALNAGGIPHRIEGDRILVPRDRLAEARAILQQEVLGAGGSPTALEQFAERDDIWSSQAQAGRRWQAAKMADLSRTIRKFPTVRSASVIFEDGAAAGLGGPKVEPTASVAVELKPRCAMTDDLVDAIADLVSGTVAGMKRENVRIVDGAGRSYRAVEPSAEGSDALCRLRAAESYFARKVREAVGPIEGATVSVRAELPPSTGSARPEMVGGRQPLPRCVAVRVAIPRSHFQALAAGASGTARPDEAAVQAAATAGLEKVRENIVAALGADEDVQIKVDCRDDAIPVWAEASAAKGGPGWAAYAIGAVVGASAAAVLGAVLGWPPRRRRAGASAPPGGAQTVEYGGPGELSVLRWASAEDVLSLVREEHPQTVAVVLSALPVDRAAAVLAALPEEAQLEVARRLAAMDNVDPHTLREVDRALAGRLAESGGEWLPATAGPTRLADILRRTGPRVETRVLQALAKDLPELAGSLRRKAFSFEDIVGMSDSRLAEVLEAIDTRRLAVALRTAPGPVAEKVFACLSAPTARRLRVLMNQESPVRLSEVEAAQQQVVEELLRDEAGRYAPVPPRERIA